MGEIMLMRRKRAGFTLIELLVVMLIIVILASMIVLFWPTMMEQQRAAEGGTLLQSWLNIAKQRALRDQAPRGVRLYFNPALSNVITEGQYIELPDDFTGGTVQTAGATLNQVVVAGIDLYGGFGASAPLLWPVQPGTDYLEILGTGQVHLITAITQLTAAPTFQVTLASNLPTSAAMPTPNYRIIRAPRVMGDEKLIFPPNVGIDFNTFAAFPPPVGPPAPAINTIDNSVDILFAPSGNIIGSQAALDFIALWVRDFNQGSVASPPASFFLGEPTIITVYTRSGFVAAHPPAPPNVSTNPFFYVLTGGSSG
jgi:prepilin-type N-terminal cleavage/methylation domain-containing protein